MSGDDSSLIIFFVFWCGVGGVVGALIGSSKGKAGTGFLLGFLFGVIGWIITACLSPRPQTGQLQGAVPIQVADYQQRLRQWAVGEAIRRDPSLGANSDPATLTRLDQAAQQIMREEEIRQLQQQATKRTQP